MKRDKLGRIPTKITKKLLTEIKEKSSLPASELIPYLKEKYKLDNRTIMKAILRA